MSDSANDHDLLRRFEPVMRFTKGERFFPMGVERYVTSASLWVQRPQQFPLRIWDQGQLTMARLVEPRLFPVGSIPYLKFIDPVRVREWAAIRLREGLGLSEQDEPFHAGRGRLARVGYISRLVDALFSLSLLLRGRVPGDTAVTAIQAYKELMGEREQYQYYGRVVRENGWVVLQYYYFYAFNNWRSGFNGANDHESDWEMAAIYLYKSEDGTLQPEWVAYAAHDFSGDDLRRRWDDPELEKVGEHPVIYVGAGSHAAYFQQGEYLAELELPILAPVQRIMDYVQTFWRRLFGQDDPSPSPWSAFAIFRIPFVDYARGDGFAIGPQQTKTWAAPGLMNPAPDWVTKYRGLWGLYAHDLFSGEDAPAGPMYNREGTVRRSWYDPLGWAGLDKVTPPNLLSLQIDYQKSELETSCQELNDEIGRKTDLYSGLEVEIEAMRDRPHMATLLGERRQALTAVADQLHALKYDLAAKESLINALDFYGRRVTSGERGPLRGHIRRPHLPASDENLRRNRLAEGWAAISIGVLMVGFVFIALFARQYFILGFSALMLFVFFIEASVRRNLSRLLSTITIILSLLAGLVLLYEFFWMIVVVLVLLSGGYIVWENLRELRHR